MTQGNLSRRAMLAGASAIAATAAPTIAQAVEHPVSAAHPDAELLALAERFDPLYRAWVDYMTTESLERFELETAIEKVSGFKPGTKWSDAYCEARRDALKTIPDKRSRAEQDARSRELIALMAALDEVAADILTFNADTREGLALQVRALMYHHLDLIEPSLDDDGESDDWWLACFVESVCSFAGVPFPPHRFLADMLREREG